MKILVLDDEEGIRSAIKRLLAKEHQVDVAANGRDGLSLAKEKAYDLFIMDLKMPEFNGVQFLQSVESAGMKKPRIIVMTASFGLIEARGKLPVPVDKIICKPFQKDELLGAVAEIQAAKSQRKNSNE